MKKKECQKQNKKMEKILEIVYNYSINNKILDIKSIERIVELIIDTRKLNNYVNNIVVESDNSKKLASYQNYLKQISINAQMIDIMLKRLEDNIIIENSFEKLFYKNLSVLQVILHEIEHAYQEKIMLLENSLEAFILRISYMVREEDSKRLYEYCLYERLAEIKSFEMLSEIVSLDFKELKQVGCLVKNDKLQRMLRGYHYNGTEYINYPIEEYLIGCNKKELLNSFDWYSDDNESCIFNSSEKYKLYDRYKYGFPISKEEYADPMKKLILFYKENYRNKILIK